MDQELELRDIRSIAGLSFLVGAWLMVSPWIFGYSSGTARWNQFAFGAAVVVFSAVRYIFPSQAWVSWTNAITSFWLLVSPFILPGYMETSAYWNQTMAALLVSS
ncbi:MAG: repeat protein, partial [Candidatus Saccharibacteria bacterium]|nr:repeat protein [Candidatus Saccharibacteria bacterium]